MGSTPAQPLHARGRRHQERGKDEAKFFEECPYGDLPKLFRFEEIEEIVSNAL